MCDSAKIVLLSGGIASIFLHSVVCLSVVVSLCHINARFLNRSTDLDAVWQVQVHLRGPGYVLHGVRGPHEKGGFWGRTAGQNMQLQIAAKPSVICCHLATANEELGGLASCHSDSAFCKITLVLVRTRLSTVSQLYGILQY